MLKASRSPGRRLASRAARGSVLLLLVVWTAPVGGQQTAPGGPTFEVSTPPQYPPAEDLFPDVTADASGDFVVVWQRSYAYPGDYGEVFARRFDANADPKDDGFRVNTSTENRQGFPAVATDPEGDFVVVWASTVDAGYFGDTDIFGQRYSSAGAALGGEFRVNSGTYRFQYNASVASDPNGNFVVAWDGNYTNIAYLGAFGQRYDASGTPAGTEFRLHSTIVASTKQADPVVATDGSGNFVAVWQSTYYGSYEERIIHGRRFDSQGAALGDEFQIGIAGAGYGGTVELAANANGEFVVVWDDYVEDPYGPGTNRILARVYDSAGMAKGGQFQVNASKTTPYGFPIRDSLPDVAWGTQGGFWVVWGSGGERILARRYDVAGNAGGPEFRVDLPFFPYSSQARNSAVAAVPGGEFVVTWEGPYQFPGNRSVLARVVPEPRSWILHAAALALLPLLGWCAPGRSRN